MTFLSDSTPVRGDAGAAHAEQRVHLVEEDDDGNVLARLVPSLLEHLAQLVLRLAHVLVQQLGTLHVEEVGRGLLAGALLDALGQAVGDRLGDERLSAARRAVQQDALGRVQLVLREDVRVGVGQLDRIAQDLDLLAEAADLVVGRVGDLFQHHLFHRRLRQLLEGVVGARVVEHVISDLQLLAAQRLRQRHHPLVVGVPEDDGPVVGDEVDDGGDLAAGHVARGLDHVERLVQDDQLPLLELERVEVRVHVDAHLAAVHEDLGRAVLVGTVEDPVVVGRRAELVHLLLEELDLLLGFLEHGHEPLVLSLGVRALLPGDLVAAAQRFELGHEPLEPALELVRVASEHAHGVLKVFDLVLVRPGGRPLSLVFGRVSAPARCGGRDPAHHVVYEALPARAGIELAHATVSSFTAPTAGRRFDERVSKTRAAPLAAFSALLPEPADRLAHRRSCAGCATAAASTTAAQSRGPESKPLPIRVASSDPLARPGRAKRLQTTAWLDRRPTPVREFSVKAEPRENTRFLPLRV
jgi:hypothetical protein